MSSIRSVANLAFATTTANREARVARYEPAGKSPILDGPNGRTHSNRGLALGTPKERSQ